MLLFCSNAQVLLSRIHLGQIRCRSPPVQQFNTKTFPKWRTFFQIARIEHVVE